MANTTFEFGLLSAHTTWSSSARTDRGSRRHWVRPRPAHWSLSSYNDPDNNVSIAPSHPTMSCCKLFNSNILRSWYRLCLVASSAGCFYWQPFEQVYPNAAPIIEFSSPDQDDVFRIDGTQGGVAWVSVVDPDEGDVMDYLWTITGLGPQGTAQTFVSGNYQGKFPPFNFRVTRCWTDVR